MDLSELYQPVEEDDKGRKISQNLYNAIEVNSDFDLSCMYIATHDKVKNGLSAVSNNLESFAYNFYPQQFENPIVGWCFGRKTNGATNYWMDITFGKGEFDRPKFGSSGNTEIRVVSDININEYALRGVSIYCYDPDNIGSDLRPVGIGNKDFAYLLENPDKLCRIGSLGLMYKFTDQSSENLQPTMMINGKVTGFVSPYSLFCTNSKYGVQCNYVTGAQNGGWSDSDSNYANDTAWVNYDTPDRFLEAVPVGLTYNLQDSGRLENGEIVFENDVCVAYYRKDFTYRCDAIEWYYKVSWVLEVIASMGVYVQTTNTKYNSLDELIDSGNCYLGEMTDEGVSTGRFLHERAEIEAAYNYNINTDNSPVNPYEKDTDDNDDIEDMEIGLSYMCGGMVNYYNISKQHLDDLSEAISNTDIIPEGKNVLPNLISLKYIPIDSSYLCRGTLTDVTIAGVNTHVGAFTVDSTYTTINLGSFAINGKFGTASSPHFLDYSPYTTLELYIPFCGWVALGDVAMYKTISVYLLYDIVEATCIGVVKANGTVIAQCNGVIGGDIPFTADNVGAKQVARMNAALGIGSSALSLGVGIATGNPIAISSGVLGAVSSINNSIVANNTNYTEVKGNSADRCNFGLMKKCYIKIQRPIAKVPESYGHTIGYVCNKTKSVSACSGYTVFDNVDVSGVNATESEKSIIKNLLESGIYC